MIDAKEVISEVDEVFGKVFGRRYGGLFEEYGCEGAEAVIIGMGTIASTARPVIDELRKEGKKVGLVKLKAFRPFPDDELRGLSEKYHAIGVIDRNISIGGGGVVFGEVRNALFDMEDRPRVIGFHTGLAGKEVTPEHVRKMAEKTLKAAQADVEQVVEWV
jgi:pyruvate ferredoxin oxidoreductase alpha subunit